MHPLHYHALIYMPMFSKSSHTAQDLRGSPEAAFRHYTLLGRDAASASFHRAFRPHSPRLPSYRSLRIQTRRCLKAR